jgi:pyruvate ferredoxin oxidoreductase gamma subunit
VFQVRVHGRGGQGVVTAAEMLAVAAFHEGRHAQAFPSFGSERTGAPVVAFARISDRAIRVREPIVDPDAVLVQDATLLGHVDVFGGLVVGGTVVVNTARDADQLAALYPELTDVLSHAVTVNATELALTHVGSAKPGGALLGAFAAATGALQLASVVAAINERFSGALAEGNVAAATAAYDDVRRRGLTRVPATAEGDTGAQAG